MSKVAPIRKKYETVSAMVAHIMGDDTAKSAFICYFDGESNMSVAELGLTVQDFAMVLLEVTQRASNFEF